MSEKLDAHEIAYYAVRGTNRDPVKDVAEVEKMIEEYAEAKAGQHETIVIWAALHNPNIHESAAYTISLHTTKEGAEKAVEESKKDIKKEHDEVYSDSDNYIPEWDRFHSWGVEKQEVSTK